MATFASERHPIAKDEIALPPPATTLQLVQLVSLCSQIRTKAEENQIEDVLLETFSDRIRRVCGQLSSKTKSYILGLIRFGGPFWDLLILDPQRISGGRGRRLAIPLGRVPRFPDGQFERNF